MLKLIKVIVVLIPVVAFFIGASLALFVVWLNGFDFDERGKQAADAFLLALWAGIVCSAFGVLPAMYLFKTELDNKGNL